MCEAGNNGKTEPVTDLFPLKVRLDLQGRSPAISEGVLAKIKQPCLATAFSTRLAAWNMYYKLTGNSFPFICLYIYHEN
jgi:hypothetical protein